MKKIPRFFW